jgi:hypothetical protein
VREQFETLAQSGLHCGGLCGFGRGPKEQVNPQPSGLQTFLAFIVLMLKSCAVSQKCALGDLKCLA